MSSFEVSWRDEVSRYVVIEAATKEEAYQKWASGDYKLDDTRESDCQSLSDKQEIMDDMRDLKDE